MSKKAGIKTKTTGFSQEVAPDNSKFNHYRESTETSLPRPECGWHSFSGSRFNFAARGAMIVVACPLEAS